MSIGLAIVLSTIIYVLYKTGVLTSRKFWRRAAKTLAVCTVLGLLALGGLYEYSHHEDQQEAKQEVARQTAPPCLWAGQLNPDYVSSVPNFIPDCNPKQIPVRCYKKNGDLVPDEFTKFGGHALQCTSNEIAVPVSPEEQNANKLGFH